MKVLIVYYSAYRKNTEKIAECMREQFAGEMVHTKDYNENDIDKYDMIGFGSGVYNQ
jgi:flavodoxin